MLFFVFFLKVETFAWAWEFYPYWQRWRQTRCEKMMPTFYQSRVCLLSSGLYNCTYFLTASIRHRHQHRRHTHSEFLANHRIGCGFWLCPTFRCKGGRLWPSRWLPLVCIYLVAFWTLYRHLFPTPTAWSHLSVYGAILTFANWNVSQPWSVKPEAHI